MSGKQIDWNEIHRRLGEVNAAIEQSYSPGAADRERILKARAEALAREPADAKNEDSIEVVEFILANEYYGIESRYIREVCPIKEYTPLPGAPPFVLGLINLRGEIISVIDIKKFFDMPDIGISDLNKVIIIHDDTLEFGILTDSILGVRNIALHQIKPPPPTLTGILVEYLKGVTGERIVILDAGRLLADENIIVHEES